MMARAFRQRSGTAHLTIQHGRAYLSHEAAQVGLATQRDRSQPASVPFFFGQFLFRSTPPFLLNSTFWACWPRSALAKLESLTIAPLKIFNRTIWQPLFPEMLTKVSESRAINPVPICLGICRNYFSKQQFPPVSQFETGYDIPSRPSSTNRTSAQADTVGVRTESCAKIFGRDWPSSSCHQSLFF
jgi:hypothetical protein